jgi:Phage integrase family
VVVVLGKGRRPRAVPFGRKTALALDRYLRMRASHPFAQLPNLWLGRAGAMTPSGLFQVVAARGAAAGLPTLHPHQFRHSFADSWLSAGGNEGDRCAWLAGGPARWSTAIRSPPRSGVRVRRTAVLSAVSAVARHRACRSTKGHGSSWVFGPYLTCANALRRAQHPAFSLVWAQLRSSRPRPLVPQI